MPTFKDFTKILYAKIKKNGPQATARHETSADLLRELQTTYQNYEEHMLLKVLPILQKEINSAIDREVKKIDEQIKQLEQEVKTKSNQIGQLARKGNFYGKNTAEIAEHQKASRALRSQLEVLEKKRIDLIFSPQREKLRQIKECMRKNKNDVRGATALAWQLCQEIQNGSPVLSIASIKSTNDQDNIKRFLKVVELRQILNQGPPESIVAFYNVFKNQGGEKAILGEKLRSFFTEKGSVWRKTTELLTKIAASKKIDFDTEIKKQKDKQPTQKTDGIHEEKNIGNGPARLTRK